MTAPPPPPPAEERGASARVALAEGAFPCAAAGTAGLTSRYRARAAGLRASLARSAAARARAAGVLDGLDEKMAGLAAAMAPIQVRRAHGGEQARGCCSRAWLLARLLSWTLFAAASRSPLPRAEGGPCASAARDGSAQTTVA